MNALLGALGALLMAAVVAAMFHDNGYIISLLIAALTIAGVALAWALLGNLGGMISLGHAAFFGVGGYASAILAKSAGWPVLLAIPSSGLIAAIAALVMLPILRLRGAYFALAVLAYAQVFRILATELSGLTGGAAGLLSIPGIPSGIFGLSTDIAAYSLVIGVIIFLAICYDRIRRSYSGLALRAMHDSETATSVVGVPVFRLKAAMLLLSAFATGIFGAFNAHVIGFLQPDYAFSGDWSIFPMVAAMFGGYRTVSGPVIGAIAIYLMDQLVFKNLMPQGHQIVLGVLLCAMILFSPRGLVPIITRGRIFARKDSRRVAT